MRNKYNKEFEDFVKQNAKNMKKTDLLKLINSKFEFNMTKHNLEIYLYRHGIKCKDYHKFKVRNVYKCPIGTEYIKEDGMTLIKIGQPSVWDHKQRVLYCKYHNCSLTNEDFIIFLNGDRTDFSKENLQKISRRESSILANQKLFSKDRDLTKLGITSAKLMIKIKEKTKNAKKCGIKRLSK